MDPGFAERLRELSKAEPNACQVDCDVSARRGGRCAVPPMHSLRSVEGGAQGMRGKCPSLSRVVAYSKPAPPELARRGVRMALRGSPARTPSPASRRRWSTLGVTIQRSSNSSYTPSRAVAHSKHRRPSPPRTKTRSARLRSPPHAAQIAYSSSSVEYTNPAIAAAVPGRRGAGVASSAAAVSKAVADARLGHAATERARGQPPV